MSTALIVSTPLHIIDRCYTFGTICEELKVLRDLRKLLLSADTWWNEVPPVQVELCSTMYVKQAINILFSCFTIIGKLMKIFLDSAEIDEIRTAIDAGILDGVTTNPSLLKAAVDKRLARGEKTDIAEYIKAILQACKHRTVSLEVLEGNADELVRQAMVLWNTFKKYGNAVIKIPVSPSLEENDSLSYEGVKAIRLLAGKDIPVNTTLIMTPLQALLAAKAGAKYVSPFAGRIDDYLRTEAKIKFGKEDYYPKDGMKEKMLNDAGIASGVDLVRSIVQIFRNYDVECEVIAASLRNTQQAREVAETGADIATVPFSVLRQLLNHPKTLEGMKRFIGDAPEEYKRLFG